MRRLWRILPPLAVVFMLRAPLGRAFGTLGGSAIAVVGAPFWSAGVRVREFFQGDRETLISRAAELERQRNSLIVENAKLRDAARENERLSALLEFVKRAGVTVRAARVIGGSADPDLHVIDIDIGSAEGVYEGDAVVTDDGVVVGKISEARQRAATVELVTDARSRFAASLLSQERSALSGVVEGGHGTGMVMRLIPQAAKVGVGDPVITAGLEAGIPRGLLLGRVESVVPEPNEPFQTATLSPLTDLDTITAVAVVEAPR